VAGPAPGTEHALGLTVDVLWIGIHITSAIVTAAGRPPTRPLRILPSRGGAAGG